MAKKVAVWQPTKALTVSSETSGRNGASVSQVVGPFPSGVERVHQHPVDQDYTCANASGKNRLKREFN